MSIEKQKTPNTKKLMYATGFVFLNCVFAGIVSTIMDWFFIMTLFLFAILWVVIFAIIGFWIDMEG